MRDPGPPPEILIVAETDAATGDVRVRCRGRLVAGYTDEFDESVGKFIPGSKRIVLDFNDLTYMDSSGLGAVVRLYVSAKSAGGTDYCWTRDQEAELRAPGQPRVNPFAPDT
jgi:anti-anti-sigma factor